MPKDVSSDIRIEPVAGKPVELPNGNFIANAEMTRVGTDLHLSSPDGQTIVVEGYFTQDPAPDLITADGARMSPQLVDSFLPPEHIGQYASSGQITNDASAAGKITEVIGEAHIVRSDGTQILATIGTSVFQGDVIETSKTGAVNILFADNTTFAVSESARLAVDQFVYNSAEQSGSSFFSMLQGMFVYTSGMIGKSDPGNVSIETPVGSIGIRGTVVAGE
ncbi:MAG: FecR domain-containing protein, partial [Alphaproteobacteria bacterium]|nr:FecR domain-containing protein [Alphaproteobacteria bacterium]